MSMPDPTNVAEVSGVYQLLSRLWMREVDGGLLAELVNGSLASTFQEAGGTPPASADVETQEQLSIDYCQLFLGPQNHFPPFQSVWTGGQFQDMANASMKKYLGLLPEFSVEGPGGNMLDHLGIQLGVMAAIIGAVPSANADDQGAILELAGHFFRDHLAWPEQLLDAAEPRCQTEFYRSVIRLTREFLRLESDQWLNDAAR